jgi:hypothetical protein
MAGENILAVQFSAPQPQEVLPVTGIHWDDGLRAILSVRMVWAKLQTTVLFGDSLYMLSYDIGQLTKQDGFKAFLQSWFNRPVIGAQLSQPPFAATPTLYTRVGYGSVPPPPPPVATGTITLLDAGFDPFRGYWIEFAGNYFLTFPLFKNWPNVIRDTPNFKGAQGTGSGSPGSPSGSGTPPVIPPTTC